MICFAHGSLGYMCNFTFDEFQKVCDQVFKDKCKLHFDNRLRLKVTVPGDQKQRVYKGNNLQSYEEMAIKEYHVLNEVVIDRGPSPFAIQIEIYFDGHFMTTLVGDGLILSTPTGSTAYNMAAGGSIVQANAQCICLTPIAPHSLSFRPLILPVSTEIKLKKPSDNRNSAFVALDGATRFELKDSEEIIISGSDSNLSMVVNPSDNLMDLWGQRLVNQLNWNQRKHLRALQKM